MTNRSSFRVIMLLAFITGSAQADYACEGPLEAGSWFVKPKIGVAPSIFAGRRARQQFVIPRAGAGDAIDPCDWENNFQNTLQEGPCLPKFSDMFNQGVLHVGIELGYNVCDRSPWFLEFVYNRASGKCVAPCGDYITNRATLGCSKVCSDTDSACNFDNNNCNDNCCPTGDTLSNICNITDDYDNYSAYGAYIGGRYFTDTFWCDTTSWFFGYKVGILHRRAVEACTTLTVPSQPRPEVGCDPNETQNIEFRRAIFCKSNSVSGGIQTGFDYCYSDCLSFQLGFEVVASCGLRGNRNHFICINDIKDGAGGTQVNDTKLPSNILIRDTGALVNFPIWVGLKWEFGSWCNPCSPCEPCNPCA